MNITILENKDLIAKNLADKQAKLAELEKQRSQLIEEKELIDDIISKVESFKKNQNHRMDQFIDFDANVRDWKIKNILE